MMIMSLSNNVSHSLMHMQVPSYSCIRTHAHTYTSTCTHADSFGSWIPMHSIHAHMCTCGAYAHMFI